MYLDPQALPQKMGTVPGTPNNMLVQRGGGGLPRLHLFDPSVHVDVSTGFACFVWPRVSGGGGSGGVG